MPPTSCTGYSAASIDVSDATMDAVEAQSVERLRAHRVMSTLTVIGAHPSEVRLRWPQPIARFPIHLNQVPQSVNYMVQPDHARKDCRDPRLLTYGGYPGVVEPPPHINVAEDSRGLIAVGMLILAGGGRGERTPYQ